MKFVEKGKNLVEDAKILATDKELREEILRTVIGAVLGDLEPVGKVAGMLLGLPDKIFWSKMERFLKGVYLRGGYLCEEDRKRLCAKFDEKGKKEENAFRLVSIIDRVESMQKIRYLIRATRCLMDGQIDCPTYFRICHVIMQALDEDLEFLKEHRGEEYFSYSASVQGLLTVGLMHESVIALDGVKKYSFVPFAGVVYDYAVDDSLEADLGSAGKIREIGNPRTQVVLSTATDEDIDGLFQKD